MTPLRVARMLGSSLILVAAFTAPTARADMLLNAPSNGAYYGMYCADPCQAASFTLNSTYYMSTIDVILHTPTATKFISFDFSLQDSLTGSVTTVLVPRVSFGLQRRTICHLIEIGGNPFEYASDAIAISKRTYSVSGSASGRRLSITSSPFSNCLSHLAHWPRSFTSGAMLLFVPRSPAFALPSEESRQCLRRAGLDGCGSS